MPTVKVNDLNTYFEIHGVGETLVNVRGKGMETTYASFSVSRIIAGLRLCRKDHNINIISPKCLLLNNRYRRVL